MERKNYIEGRKTILIELEPKYFEYIIKWRNDKKLNRYINQPFELTMELEKKWYENNYLNDSTQMLYVMLDKENNKPFGTIGYINYDEKENICISARLIAGEPEYQSSLCLIDGLLTFFDYLYNNMNIKTVYSHVVIENKMSLRLQKRFGLIENPDTPCFPERLHDNDLPMVEIYGTKERFETGRKKIEKLLEGLL